MCAGLYGHLVYMLGRLVKNTPCVVSLSAPDDC